MEFSGGIFLEYLEYIVHLAPVFFILLHGQDWQHLYCGLLTASGQVEYVFVFVGFHPCWLNVTSDLSHI